MNDLLIYGIGGAIITIACQIIILDTDRNPVNWKPFIAGSLLGIGVLVALYFVLSWIS